ncbi:MAG: hypothetical protein ETSY2_08030 [Candidatus Entotheonella gemina]|uniref:LuxR family transcriptional regulator n=1 Tax=Candidatus Entotheonella gemina TaxID=1429439 RepID=W4MCA7_9BACT|nr:MAG: hypothetical protein ETSY2_08030 [Candidatus Entotheonella gemina]
MSVQPTVFVVDDDPLVLRTLERVITSAGWPVDTYPSGVDFLAVCNPNQPGCIVLDLRMPQISGLTIQEQLTARGVSMPIIFITAYGEVSTAVQAMKAGAVDFLEKPFSNQALLTCVEYAMARDARARQIRAERDEVSRRTARLSRREQEVSELIVAGYTNKEIGDQLGIRVRTVEAHRQRAMKKLQARSVAELTRIVLSANRAGPAASSDET